MFTRAAVLVILIIHTYICIVTALASKYRPHVSFENSIYRCPTNCTVPLTCYLSQRPLRNAHYSCWTSSESHNWNDSHSLSISNITRTLWQHGPESIHKTGINSNIYKHGNCRPVS